MAHVKFEIERHGWQIRSECDGDFTTDQIINQLKLYAVGYPHRAWMDGELVAEITKPRGERSKVTVL